MLAMNLRDKGDEAVSGGTHTMTTRKSTFSNQ